MPTVPGSLCATCGSIIPNVGSTSIGGAGRFLQRVALFRFLCRQTGPFYERRFDFLADFNLGLLECLCGAARIPMPAVSETYVEARPGDCDLRPKTPKARPLRPSLTCRSSPTVSRSSLICLLRICCLRKDRRALRCWGAVYQHGSAVAQRSGPDFHLGPARQRHRVRNDIGSRRIGSVLRCRRRWSSAVRLPSCRRGTSAAARCGDSCVSRRCAASVPPLFHMAL